jgi:hypothetical protein
VLVVATVPHLLRHTPEALSRADVVITALAFLVDDYAKFFHAELDWSHKGIPQHWRERPDHLRGPVLHQFNWHRTTLDECHEIVDTLENNYSAMAVIQSLEVRGRECLDAGTKLGSPSPVWS